jgi:hypothetical protein
MRARNVHIQSWIRAVALAVMALAGAAGLTAAEPQSPRLDRAKDHIADERWRLAIVELKGAANDTREASRDEALFWLAHSHNQAGDSASAMETIHRLEQEFPKSRWVKPARSLRIEIAQRLRRIDVLMWTAVPPPPPPTPTVPPTPVVGPSPATGPTPAPAPGPRMHMPMPRPARIAPAPPTPPRAAAPTPAPSRLDHP